MKVKLDLKKSAPENANDYYRRSKKLRRKITGAQKALQETLKQIRHLEDKRNQEETELLEKEKAASKKVKTHWYEKFRHFFSSDDFLVIGGKDATSNEVIIKRHLEKGDMVFHAHVQGAPFFVIKNLATAKIPSQTLQETAQMAASYSKAWKQGLGSCDIYYITPEQVSKKAPSGEYLAKGAFVISGKKEWFRHTELKVAIGIKVTTPIEVITGPPSAVAATSDYLVMIKPGYLKPKELAEKTKKQFLRQAKKEDREKIKRIPLDEIQRQLPAGKGALVK